MKSRLFLLSQLILVICLVLSKCSNDHFIRNYTGIPFSDNKYNDGAQTIPGKIQCEYFDFGGEGIAYHDLDIVNSGSGNLNKQNNNYLHEFRMDESVDISYTKPNQIDNNAFNFIQPEMNQLYVGWTEPGEWLNYTINVQTKGIYKIGLMYTSNGEGQISLSINSNDITGPIDILSTNVSEDTLDWRQWHHWNYLDSIAEVKLKKGLQILTIHTISNGNMNYDYLLFTLKN